ncbi:MAG: hypothetical protein ACOCVL_02330, partial [Candidatus Sumerlaeota bacterium]
MQDTIHIRVGKQALHPVDGRLFGHFMERASWGEPGYDFARNAEHPERLDPQVVEKLEWMDIPVIRFPAGSDLKRIDWSDMIDNAPDRQGDRPIFADNKHGKLTNLFGIDEFLSLCEELGSEALLPVRFYPALSGDVPPDKAAREAAELVAYCNAEIGAELPEGMADWPAIRAQNGRPAPWKVRYFQIGNETWTYYKSVREKVGMDDNTPPEKIAKWYIQCLHAYIDAIRAVDPDVEIIIDGTTNLGQEVDRLILSDNKLRREAQYAALHLYQPWGIRSIKKGEEEIPVGQLSAEDIWYAWTTLPAIDPTTGFTTLDGHNKWQRTAEMGWPIAATEWNWNGWWRTPDSDGDPALNSRLAKGVGAAGMLHAFMRQGENVKIGCQSMLVGVSWDITGIRVGRDGEAPPHFHPTGLVTGFYSRHHGNERLPARVSHLPRYDQPYRMSGIKPASSAAAVDVVVTNSDDKVFIHAINRHFSGPQAVQVHLEELKRKPVQIIHHRLTGRLSNKPTEKFPGAEAAIIDQEEIEDIAPIFDAILPPRSVSIIEVTL